jgi:hypothetical protein
MPQCSPRSLEHWLTAETLASVLPPDSTVSASPATLVPPEAPDLPEEAKPEEEKDDLATKEDL